MKQQVYFAQADYGGPIKIGHTIDSEQRIANIGRDLPFNLVVIGTFPGGLFCERFVQCWFRDSNIKGEWFESQPEIWRWAMEARTTGRCHRVPDEPVWGFEVDTQELRGRMEIEKVSLEDVAKAAGRAEATLKPVFEKPFFRSQLLFAAACVCLARKGRELDWAWPCLRFSPLVEQKGKVVSLEEEAA